jgi:hypothetical protein
MPDFYPIPMSIQAMGIDASATHAATKMILPPRPQLFQSNFILLFPLLRISDLTTRWSIIVSPNIRSLQRRLPQIGPAATAPTSQIVPFAPSIGERVSRPSRLWTDGRSCQVLSGETPDHLKMTPRRRSRTSLISCIGNQSSYEATERGESTYGSKRYAPSRVQVPTPEHRRMRVLPALRPRRSPNRLQTRGR